VTNFLFGFFVGFSVASFCWIAFMIHVSNKVRAIETGAKAGE